MRSLRLRFFLISWPLTVLAVGIVAVAFNRWTEVKLTEHVFTDAAQASGRARVDSVLGPWVDGRMTATALGARLRGLARRDSIQLVVVDTAGSLVAAGDTRVTLAPGARMSSPGAPLAFESAENIDGSMVVQRVDVTGRPLMGAGGKLRGAVYRVPSSRPPDAAAALRNDLRGTLVTAVLVASALSALLSLLLAGPLVAQVARLGAAAGAVRGGRLDTRVPVSSADELGKMEVAFNEMTASLERAEVHKRNLVHDVAHDLRTPLTNVVGMLEAIEDRLRVPDAVTLRIVRNEVALLVALVNDLQELSMAESGQLPFEIGAVDLRAECAAAVHAMRPQAEGRLLHLGPLASDAEVFVRADARRLGQVLRNLLRNALTHTPAGGTVTVSVTPRDKEVGVIVSDTGAGIPAAHLELIWERFHRVDPARERGGHGLGLAIVKQFVERMSGRVAVSSVEGEGSTFEVWLRRVS